MPGQMVRRYTSITEINRVYVVPYTAGRVDSKTFAAKGATGGWAQTAERIENSGDVRCAMEPRYSKRLRVGTEILPHKCKYFIYSTLSAGISL